MGLVSVAGRRAKKATQASTANQPRILIHAINDDRCTGCDACVAVCPTNVLDLVDNKSRVLRFQDCIQCEACMWACPTEALVMHLEGTEPPKLKMPELDAFYQTAIPGQYLIGEVAGKPLVKNAANLGRAAVEHMLAEGLQPGALHRRMAEGSDAANVACVDVAIVGSGPGGLSAALSCIQRGLSYVLLEKEQMIASTIARYPKGKLVMAEPYDTRNVSLLPVFDSSKEQLLPLWQDLIDRVGVEVTLGEAVEKVERRTDGVFNVTTTQRKYRAQRVVLATGTRGKPRTLGVRGENLPKVRSLLDDPSEFRGKPVLVVGGGDSALEASMALADAGARVVLSYRGRQFNRAAPKNKQRIADYAGQKRIKVKFQSNVKEFDADTVTLKMANGTLKKYPNQAAFVPIGSDPPIKWLKRLGVDYVERPHSYSLSKSDDLVVQLVGDVDVCPETADAAASRTLGRHYTPQPMQAVQRRAPMQLPAEALPLQAPLTGGPRKWLRSASQIFTGNRKKEGRSGRGLDRPMPLSEFAKRGRMHTGHGRRDELDASERTRVLRMLRDEGGRLADEDSQVYVVDTPPHIEDRRHAGSVPVSRIDEDSAPRQAVIVGLARAMADAPRRKRRTSRQPMSRPRVSAQPQFADEATRQIDSASALDDLLRQSRNDAPTNGHAPINGHAPTNGHAANNGHAPTNGHAANNGFPVEVDESTRAIDFDARAFMNSEAYDSGDVLSSRNYGDGATGAIDIKTDAFAKLDDMFPDESTRAIDVNQLANIDAVAANHYRREQARQPRRPAIEPPRSAKNKFGPRVNTLSDVDWDLD